MRNGVRDVCKWLYGETGKTLFGENGSEEMLGRERKISSPEL